MPIDRDHLERLRDLMQRHCFRYGDFTLTSGRTSKYYYDGKRVTLRPSGAALIGEALVDVLFASGAEAVGGPELGAVPIAMAVGLASVDRSRPSGEGLPVFVVRKQQREHGTRDRIAEAYGDDVGAPRPSGEGPLLTSGRRVAIVEDTITTGGSVRQAIDVVEELGCEVVLVAVLVERHEGGADELRAQGYDVVSLFRADENGRLSINQSFVERLAAAQDPSP